VKKVVIGLVAVVALIVGAALVLPFVIPADTYLSFPQTPTRNSFSPA